MILRALTLMHKCNLCVNVFDKISQICWLWFSPTCSFLMLNWIVKCLKIFFMCEWGIEVVSRDLEEWNCSSQVFTDYKWMKLNDRTRLPNGSVSNSPVQTNATLVALFLTKSIISLLVETLSFFICQQYSLT